MAAIADEKLRPVCNQIAPWSLANINPKLTLGACPLERLPKSPNFYSSGQQIRNNLEKEHVAKRKEPHPSSAPDFGRKNVSSAQVSDHVDRQAGKPSGLRYGYRGVFIVLSHILSYVPQL